jgi:hypothetical protein
MAAGSERQGPARENGPSAGPWPGEARVMVRDMARPVVQAAGKPGAVAPTAVLVVTVATRGNRDGGLCRRRLGSRGV